MLTLMTLAYLFSKEVFEYVSCSAIFKEKSAMQLSTIIQCVFFVISLAKLALRFIYFALEMSGKVIVFTVV